MGTAHDTPLLALSSLERGVLVCDLASCEIVMSNTVAQLQLRSLGFDGHSIPPPLRVAICASSRAHREPSRSTITARGPT